MKKIFPVLILFAFSQCKVSHVVTTPTNDSLITHGNEIGVVEPSGMILEFEDEPKSKEEFSTLAVAANQPYPKERAIYLDRTDNMYKNITESNRFAKYCKDNKFTRVDMYRPLNILQSSSNFPAFAVFLRKLYDNGVTRRNVVLGSAGTTSLQKYLTWQSDTTKEPNGINYEREWWNGATSFSTWINELATLDAFCDSKNPDMQNSFYMGWFKYTGLTDSAAARKQQQESDFIDIHIYQDGKVSYSYGSSRYVGHAKGAKGRGKPVILNPIISAEEIDWGASYNFQGYYLKALGYWGIEKAFIDDWNAKATSEVKTWCKIGEFKYFMWRYCYRAVPAIP